MIQAIDIQAVWVNLGPIFLLMFSAFILGYVLASYFAKIYITKTLFRLKNELENIPTNDKIKDIDVGAIFTKINTEDVYLVKELLLQQKQIIPRVQNKTTEKATSNYISYTKQEVVLDLFGLGVSTPETPDDLTKIIGIGPYIEERLNSIGVYNYEQIIKLDVSSIRAITELIEFFPGRIERDDWVGQAKDLISFRSKL